MSPRKSKDEGVINKVLNVVETGAELVSSYLDKRYRLEKKVDELVDETGKKIEKFREEVVGSAYAVKRAFFRTIVEGVLITTGLISLIVGLVILFSRQVPLEHVLIIYGLLVSLIILWTTKTSSR